MVMDGNTCVVEEYDPQLHLALTQRDPMDNISYIAATLQEIDKNHIVRPKGYTVSWHVNPELEKHHFGHSHPMKPWRLTLAKGLIMSYGMHHAMDTYISRQATKEEMADFHTEAYLDHLRTAIPVPPDDDTVKDFNLGGSDCPIFEGLFNYCSMYSGASIDAARRLCNNQSDIAINWSGGLHHAKKAEASGFCYANDIVLAILELLRVHPRVLYIDIDVHHGDGVEEAFWSTDRVMTLSFHKYDGNNFFPGTGELERNGPMDNRNPGAHHALNVPLQDGITDEQYEYLFTNVVGMCFQKYRPDAIVLQCGADSLAGDRLGRFNLQVQGHGKCVEYCKSLNVPLLLVGGGGYTPRNVARAWAHETSIAIDCPLDPVIPQHTPYRSHFRYETIFPTLEEILGEQRHNKNTEKRIQEIIRHTKNELDCCAAAPSVQFTRIPPSLDGCKAEIDERMAEEVKDTDEYQKQKEAGLGVDMEL